MPVYAAMGCFLVGIVSGEEVGCKSHPLYKIKKKPLTDIRLGVSFCPYTTLAGYYYALPQHALGTQRRPRLTAGLLVTYKGKNLCHSATNVF